MNVAYIKSLSVLFLFFSFVISAQEIKEKDQLPITNQDKFIALSQVGNALNPSDQTVPASILHNTIFIQQIGTENRVFSNINAESSDVKIIQNGEYNAVEINETASRVEKAISQSGNNNSIIDFSFNPDISTKLELIQEGNNLTFERLGSNELSKNLKFKMSGSAKTIIVRSF